MKSTGKWKNDDRVKAMFSMYETGKSLNEVAGIYRKHPKTLWDMFTIRGYQLRPKNSVPIQFVDGIKFSKYLKGRFWVSTRKPRVLLHRYIWEKHNGPIPENHGIVHTDGNYDNNGVENLACLSVSQIAREQKHFNQYILSNGTRRTRGQIAKILNDLRWERSKQHNPY